MTKIKSSMKNRIIKGIRNITLLLNFFLILGMAGGCDLEYITLKECIIKSVIIIIFSIIPALKIGIFRNR